MSRTTNREHGKLLVERVKLEQESPEAALSEQGELRYNYAAGELRARDVNGEFNIRQVAPNNGANYLYLGHFYGEYMVPTDIVSNVVWYPYLTFPFTVSEAGYYIVQTYALYGNAAKTTKLFLRFKINSMVLNNVELGTSGDLASWTAFRRMYLTAGTYTYTLEALQSSGTYPQVQEAAALILYVGGT